MYELWYYNFSDRNKRNQKHLRILKKPFPKLNPFDLAHWNKHIVVPVCPAHGHSVVHLAIIVEPFYWSSD
jgi:hypothetical protein